MKVAGVAAYHRLTRRLPPDNAGAAKALTSRAQPATQEDLMDSSIRVRRSLTVAVAAMVIGLWAGATAGQAVRPAKESGTARFEFGIVVPDPDGMGARLVETTEVPRVNGQAFGWRILNDAPDRKVKWVEVLKLPAAPKSWQGVADDPTVVISGDGRTATTADASTPGSEYISHLWFVSAGDPIGEYQMTVELDDGRTATFWFRIAKPKPGVQPPEPSPGEVI